MTITKKLLAANISVLALTVSLALPASAQLDEIVVTAQKREQSLQDVPIAVSTVDREYIESRNISDIKSLATLAPNLKID